MDLLRKSIDWFLYDIGLRHERVNINPENGLVYKKVCNELQILEAIQNAFVLIYPCEISS